MKRKMIKSAALALMMTGWLSTTHAASVTMSPDQSTVTLGATVTFTYSMDFSDDSTFGGGTDFWYDPNILQFSGWSFDPGGTDDPFYHRDPTDCASANTDAGCGFDADQFGPGLAQLNGMAWGNDSGSGISGPEVIGQMVFTAIGEGMATIYMAANDDGVAGNPGPFVSGNTFGVMDVTFNYGEVTVSNVPVPAAVWFLASGLGMLGGLRRFS